MNIEIRAKLFQMYADGMTYEGIGKELGVTKQRVHQILTSPMTPRTRKSKAYDFYPVLRECLKENGYSKKAFAAVLGISESTVYQKLHKGGCFTMPQAFTTSKLVGKTIEELFSNTPSATEKEGISCSILP